MRMVLFLGDSSPLSRPSVDELSNVVECVKHRGLQYRFWDRLLRVYAVIGE
jgi:hypothetical protein